MTLIGIANCENLCDCGKFIDIKVTENDNKYQIDLKSLDEFLQNPLIEGRRLYVVSNYGETDVLNGVILNELYENVGLKIRVNYAACLKHIQDKKTQLLKFT